MSPKDVATELRSLSGELDSAARSIDATGDLLDLDWGDVDQWISDLHRVQDAIDRDGREDANNKVQS